MQNVELQHLSSPLRAYLIAVYNETPLEQQAVQYLLFTELIAIIVICCELPVYLFVKSEAVDEVVVNVTTKRNFD